MRLLATAEEHLGNVDVLVNNAGTNPYFGPIIDSDEAAWDKTMEVNLRGPYVLSKHVARRMIAGGGGSDYQHCFGGRSQCGADAGHLLGNESRADHVDQGNGQGIGCTRRARQLHLSGRGQNEA